MRRLALLLALSACAVQVDPVPDDAGSSTAAVESTDASISVTITCAEPDGAASPCFGD